MNLANARYAVAPKFLFERRKNHLLSSGHHRNAPKNIRKQSPRHWRAMMCGFRLPVD
jgi:hypothetical protein